MRRLDVAMVGAGFIARTHLPAWIALGARVRVFSTDGQAVRLAEEFGVTETSTLEAALEGATVVDICTPTTTHRDIAQAAFEAGADVLCEKPLALAPADALFAAAFQGGPAPPVATQRGHLTAPARPPTQPGAA